MTIQQEVEKLKFRIAMMGMLLLIVIVVLLWRLWL